jgi:hypothetical protein
VGSDACIPEFAIIPQVSIEEQRLHLELASHHRFANASCKASPYRLCDSVGKQVFVANRDLAPNKLRQRVCSREQIGQTD